MLPPLNHLKAELTERCAAVGQARVSVAAGGGSGRRRQGAVRGRVRLVAVARTNTKRAGLGFAWLENKRSEQSDNVWAQSALHSCIKHDFFFFFAR